MADFLLGGPIDPTTGKRAEDATTIAFAGGLIAIAVIAGLVVWSTGPLS